MARLGAPLGRLVLGRRAVGERVVWKLTPHFHRHCFFEPVEAILARGGSALPWHGPLVRGCLVVPRPPAQEEPSHEGRQLCDSSLEN